MPEASVNGLLPFCFGIAVIITLGMSNQCSNVYAKVQQTTKSLSGVLSNLFRKRSFQTPVWPNIPRRNTNDAHEIIALENLIHLALRLGNPARSSSTIHFWWYSPQPGYSLSGDGIFIWISNEYKKRAEEGWMTLNVLAILKKWLSELCYVVPKSNLALPWVLCVVLRAFHFLQMYYQDMIWPDLAPPTKSSILSTATLICLSTLATSDMITTCT